MSFLKKLGHALNPKNSNVMKVVKKLPNSVSDFKASAKDPFSSIRYAADAGRASLQDTGAMARNTVNATKQTLKTARDVTAHSIAMGVNATKASIDGKFGTDPKAAWKTLKNSDDIAKAGFQTLKGGARDTVNAATNNPSGVKLGDALLGAPKQISTAAPAAQPISQFGSNAQGFQNNVAPDYQQPQAFAPQMQMPINQGMPQRVQSGMQFGSMPNPAQPQQPQMPRPQMPVFNSGPVPQYGQPMQPQTQSLPPPQNAPFAMPNRVDGVPMNRAVNAPQPSRAPTPAQMQMIMRG